MNNQTYTFSIKIDEKRDAQNWFEACNKVSHGTDWGLRIGNDILEQIRGKDQEEANGFLLPFLENKYQEDSQKIDRFVKDTTSYFNKYFAKSCQKMEEAMGQPLYRSDFTIYITSFPRGPYNKNEGSMQIYYGWDQPLKCFLHELCHFQFIHYWKNSRGIKDLSQKDFEFLKESLTVIIDSSFFPMIKDSDKGYPIHQDFRDKLKEKWEKDKDFDNLVQFGVSELPKFAKS